MGFNDFLSKIFGNKAQRDIKEITPFIDQIKAIYPEIQSLSHDELRARTETLKARIQEFVISERDQISTLKASLEEVEVEAREKIYSQIDKLEKDIIEKFEVVLEQILPEAFSIVKDTARRLSENSEIIVTANDFDRELATKYYFVTIHGDKAHFKNE